MPPGHCYPWTPSMVGIQLVSSVLIGIACVVISAVLVRFVLAAKHLPLRAVGGAFSVFILGCGFTHLMDATVIWQPWYWLDGTIRVIAAMASVATAAFLPRVLPKAQQLVKGAAIIRERGMALEAAVADLESLYKRTLELDQLKTSFFANLSHELRTPLTLIVGPVEQLLSHGRLTTEHHRELELVARNGRALLRHVNNLLDIAKLDAGKLEPHYTALDLSELVRFTAAQFESLARERSVTLAIAVPPRLPAQLDAEKVQQVVLNLLANAFRFTPPGGQVRVELGWSLDRSERSERPSASLIVADSGPGIPPADRAQIFERFRQGQSTVAHQVGGTGLGLSIVREFVALHGGDVFVSDSPEGGAEFRVELPTRANQNVRIHTDLHMGELATRASSVVHDLLEPADGEADDLDDRREVPLILLVEDNTDMRALLIRTLRPRYRVIFARDGEEGLLKAKQLAPDLIVSDLMMPRLSGEELVREVRKEASLSATPILLLTAKSDDELRTETLQNGAQDYVVKPFYADELLARVANLLTIKRTRDLLQHEVEAQQGDVEALSRQVVAQKRELSAALASAREARLQAEQASRAKSDFLSLVSHELRTPLTSIQLQLERFKRGAAGTVDGEQTQALEKIARSSARLLEMVESLLEFGRTESGHLEIVPSRVNLVALVRDVIDELRPRAEQKGLALTAEYTGDQDGVESDPRLLRLIVINLVDNAIKYTEYGSVEVRVTESGDGTCSVRVSDTGPGIDPALQERIFEPFMQLEQVRHKRGAGVGLGLALVRNIARALGARVHVESTVGSGSVFTVTLDKDVLQAA